MMMLALYRHTLVFAFSLFCLTPLYAQAPNSIAEGVVLVDEGKMEDARAFFTDYTKAHPKDAEAAFYLGRTYFNADVKEASKWFDKAIDLDESVSKYHEWLGNALGRQAQSSGKLKQARLIRRAKKGWDKAVELDPTNIDARESLIQFYLQAPGIFGGSDNKAKEQAAAIMETNERRGHGSWGDVYAHLKEYEQAEQSYRSALDTDPSVRSSYYQLAGFYRSRQNYDQAVEVFETLLALDSERTDVLYQIGLHQQMGETYEEAFVTFDKMLTLEPDSRVALYQIGRTAALSGTGLERGATSLKRYMTKEPASNEPSMAWAHYRLGQIYQHENDLAQARSAFEAALAEDKDHDEAKKALKAL